MRRARGFWAFGVLGLSLLSAGLFVSYRAYAAAGACGNCKITGLGVTSTGWVMVGTSLHMAGPCSNPNWMMVDPNTTKGKTLLSIATAAYLSGSRIDMVGTNGCTTTATAGVIAENLNTITIR